MLSLHCCAGFSLVVMCSDSSCCGAWTLGTWASVFMAPRLSSTGSVVVVHRLSCSVACGVFWDQESNLCLLHWDTREAHCYILCDVKKCMVFVFSFWDRVPKTFRISWVKGLSFVIHRVPLWAVLRFMQIRWLTGDSGGWWLGLGRLRWNLVARRTKQMIKGLELSILPSPAPPPLPWEKELEIEFNHQWPVI